MKCWFCLMCNQRCSSCSYFITKSCPALLQPYELQPARLLYLWYLPAGILEWVAISHSRGSSWPRDRTHISSIGRQILFHWATWGNRFDVHIINVVKYAVWKIPINKQKLITAFWPIATKTWAASCFGVGLIIIFVLDLGM